MVLRILLPITVYIKKSLQDAYVENFSVHLPSPGQLKVMNK